MITVMYIDTSVEKMCWN